MPRAFCRTLYWLALVMVVPFIIGWAVVGVILAALEELVGSLLPP